MRLFLIPRWPSSSRSRRNRPCPVLIRMRSRFLAVILIVLAADVLTAASDDSANRVPQDVFDGMRQSFRGESARGVHARYQWELSGPDGGNWWIEVDDGKMKMGRGKIDNPNVTFVTSDKDWVALSNGKLKGTWAVLTGRLKVRGSQSVARKLDDMFP